MTPFVSLGLLTVKSQACACIKDSSLAICIPSKNIGRNYITSLVCLAGFSINQSIIPSKYKCRSQIVLISNKFGICKFFYTEIPYINCMMSQISFCNINSKLSQLVVNRKGLLAGN